MLTLCSHPPRRVICEIIFTTKATKFFTKYTRSHVDYVPYTQQKKLALSHLAKKKWCDHVIMKRLKCFTVAIITIFAIITYAHIMLTFATLGGTERKVLRNREPTTPAVFGIRLIQHPHPKNRRGVAHQVSGHSVIIEHYHIWLKKSWCDNGIL